VDWLAVAEEKGAHAAATPGETDQRAVVRQGNAAYAAALARRMAGDAEAAAWFARAAARWRESWDLGAPPDAWGRPVGILKALVLADEWEAAGETARWTLGLGAVESPSAIGRYAATLALLVLERWPEARHQAELLREHDDFPRDVAEALAFVSAHDLIAYVESVESVIASFETREAYLEDMPVADTALVLDALARRRGVVAPLPDSPVLPPG
jgi:hypothetical protein